MVNGECQGLERGGKKLLFNGDRVSVRENETFWKWMAVMVTQQCECIFNATELCT